MGGSRPESSQAIAEGLPSPEPCSSKTWLDSVSCHSIPERERETERDAEKGRREGRQQRQIERQQNKESMTERSQTCWD